IVFMRRGRPECSHHGVANELLDRSAEPLDLFAEELEVEAQHLLDVFRVRLLGAGSESDEIYEQHGDDLALFAYAPRIGSYGERRTAEPAELESIGVLVAADGTGRHAGSLGLLATRENRPLKRSSHR